MANIDFNDYDDVFNDNLDHKYLTDYEEYPSYNHAKSKVREFKKKLQAYRGHMSKGQKIDKEFKESIDNFQKAQQSLDIIQETIDVINNIVVRSDKYVYYVDLHDSEAPSSEVHATVHLLPEIVTDMDDDISKLRTLSDSTLNDAIYVTTNIQINNHDDDGDIQLEIRSSTHNKGKEPDYPKNGQPPYM